ncbi:MAG TPA: transcription antitermination factor NusB [Acidimicrobiales bacterium]|nr:transcription antitermination factor NusB [Acidimicrobiales bacterium]
MSELGAQRHHARERALELFYEATIKDRSVDAILSALNVMPDPYTVLLVRSAEEHRDVANELISRFSQGWALDRLALIDRLIMTLAIGELLTDTTPPAAVVLDEAVELAKAYSTDGSPAFVNGVLAACVAQLEDNA